MAKLTKEMAFNIKGFGKLENMFTFVSDYSLIMTEKQERILTAALHLFAKQGYTSTSTSKVAKEAGVSEGLIFRHFENKQGLLDAIMQQGQEKVNEMFDMLSTFKDPKDVIRQIIDVPFSLKEEDKPFWKLLYALKWQAEVYDDRMSKPIKSLLVPAFQAMGYDDPEAEAEVLLMIMDGLAVALLLRKPANTEEIKKRILNKYHL